MARFIGEPATRLVGVEAAGEGLAGKHAAALAGGSPGVLHGSRSYLLQDDDGQVTEAHSISAGLDYPGIGPQLSALYAAGRLEILSATDDEAIAGVRLLARTEGILPALEPAHAIAALGAWLAGTTGLDAARRRRDRAARAVGPRRQGPRGDRRPARGMTAAGPAALRPRRSRPTARPGSAPPSTPRRREGRAALIPYAVAGYPDAATSEAIAIAAIDAGADLLEIGLPYSDPLADGATLQRASRVALAAGATLDRSIELVGRIHAARPGTPLVTMGYVNQVMGGRDGSSVLRAPGQGRRLRVHPRGPDARRGRRPRASRGRARHRASSTSSRRRPRPRVSPRSRREAVASSTPSPLPA